MQKNSNISVHAWCNNSYYSTDFINASVIDKGNFWVQRLKNHGTLLTLTKQKIALSHG